MGTMRDGGWSGSWFGFALIAVGVLFLVQNYLGYELHNWWALFVLIPAVGFFSSAWYRVWPIFVILAGVGLLLPALIGRRART